MSLPPPQPPSDEASAPLPAPPCAWPGAPALAPGRQLLIYTPEGALGGTFTCTACAAQAWQPDLLEHASACPYRPGARGSSPPPHPMTGG